MAAQFVAANLISINPHGVKLQPVGSRSANSAKPIVGRMTNAKRFAMGLPPLKPNALHRGTRAASARRASTSVAPLIPHHCNILVTKADDPSVTYGFIAPYFNPSGEYGQFQPAQAGALEVTFYVSPDVLSSAQLDMYADNGPSSSFPYFGADSDDFGPGSPNAAYVTGTSQAPPGSPAVVGDSSFGTLTGIPADYESAIWVYNALTQKISAQWINSDGSAPATHILYANDGNDVILLTGDPSQFNINLGTNYPELTFTCVPTLSAP
ncbi:hypothetical protein FRB90_012216 [Tulasnella sp. 427]|nr:hypothetical protein FRB90_012216 [Tulasnella sp. 427]